MIAYLDTSAIVKLYFDEPGAEVVRRILRESEAIAVSTVAYAETRSAFGRALRSGSLTPQELTVAKNSFEIDWAGFAIVPALETLCRRAGELAEQHALRGFDAVHLASAIQIRDREDLVYVTFATWDTRLGEAAAREGLVVPGS